MKQLPVSDLKSGMVTAEDILTYDSRVLVPRGVVLTDNIISRLDGYSVYRVSIEDKTADSLIRPIAFTAAVSNATAQFSREFNRFCEYFQENFKNTLYRNEPIHEKEIMKSFMGLISIESGTGGLLISLLNTRGLTFSVYECRCHMCLPTGLKCQKTISFSPPNVGFSTTSERLCCRPQYQAAS